MTNQPGRIHAAVMAIPVAVKEIESMISTMERRALRAKSHPLKPVVLLGQHGVTPAVIVAIDEALAAHTLVKIRLRGIEREGRDTVINDIASRMNADVINTIGHVLTLYRANPETAPPPVTPRKKPAARASAAPRVVPGYRVAGTRAVPRKSPRRGPK